VANLANTPELKDSYLTMRSAIDSERAKTSKNRTTLTNAFVTSKFFYLSCRSVRNFKSRIKTDGPRTMMTWAKYPICTRVSLIFVDVERIKIFYDMTSRNDLIVFGNSINKSWETGFINIAECTSE